MWEKQTLARLTDIQKEINSNHEFFRDDNSKTFKTHNNVGHFFKPCKNTFAFISGEYIELYTKSFHERPGAEIELRGMIKICAFG